MADIATLGLKIETAQVEQGIKSLDRLQQAGDRAEKSTKNLEDSSSRMGRAMGQAGGMASSAASQLAGVVGVTLSVAGAFYAAEKAVSSWYGMISRGVGIVDDYQKQIVGTSYILTTMSNVPPPNLGLAYGEWKNYFTWLYQQSLEADKKSAASAQEIFGVSVELAKKGVVAASEKEMDTIGRLTDLMKAVTPAYASLEMQARGEVEAMLSGTTRMGAQTAIILSQIDPLFKKNIASARENNTVLEYMRSLLPQIKQYTTDLMGTWDAVSASLKSTWQVINIKAFGDAHRDVVGFASQLAEKLVQNGQLTADGERAALALGTAWSAAKGRISEAVDYVLNNTDKVISDLEAVVFSASKIASMFINVGLGFVKLVDSVRQYEAEAVAYMGAVRASVGYLGDSFVIMGQTAKNVAHGVIWNFSEIPTALNNAYTQMELSSKRWAEQAIRDANEVRFAAMNALMPGQRPAGFAFLGGEKDTTTALSKPSSPFAPTHPNLRDRVDKDKGRSGGAGLGGMTEMASAAERAAADFQKIETLMNSIYDSAGRGIKQAEDFLSMQERLQGESLSLQKSLYDQLAQALPEEIGLKQKVLSLDLEINQIELERKLAAMDITETQKAELRGLQALTAQAKRYALTRETWTKGGGFGAGLTLYREDMNKQPAMFSGVWWKESMTGAENWIGSTFANTALDIFENRKTDFRAMGKQMLAGFFGDMMKANFRRLLGGEGGLGSWLKPQTENRIGPAGNAQWGDVPDIYKWDEAAQKWTSVADQNLLAGGNLNLAGIQGIASAASLGVGALGIITGSKELMTAAMVIQTVMMLIQTVETVSSFLPFFHTGGIITAHTGLAPNEILVRALRDEWILQPSATRDLARQGVSFDMLNTGRIPQSFLPVPVARADEGRVKDADWKAPAPAVNNWNVTFAPNLHVSEKMTKSEIKQFYRENFQAFREVAKEKGIIIGNH